MDEIVTKTDDSDRIAYRRVARILRDAIEAGDFANGRQLPTEAELGETHGVSRQTVRRALQELVSEGRIYRVRGRGTFATSASGHYLRSFGSVEDLLALSDDTAMETVIPLQPQVGIEAAGRLRLNSDQIYFCRFIRVNGDIRFCVTDAHLPPSVGQDIMRTGKLAGSSKKYRLTILELVDGSSHSVVGAQQSVTAVNAPEDIAELIDLKPDEPCLRIDRLYLDINGTPVELAISYFNPAHYTYRLTLQRSMADGGGRPN